MNKDKWQSSQKCGALPLNKRILKTDYAYPFIAMHTRIMVHTGDFSPAEFATNPDSVEIKCGCQICKMWINHHHMTQYVFHKFENCDVCLEHVEFPR